MNRCGQRFRVVDGEPTQFVAPSLAIPLPVEDLRRLPPAEREAEALRRATEEARRPFDLERGPLIRARVIRLADFDHLFLLNLHHIVSDGWSMGILWRELTTLYAAFAVGRPSPLGRFACPISLTSRSGNGAGSRGNGLIRNSVIGQASSLTCRCCNCPRIDPGHPSRNMSGRPCPWTCRANLDQPCKP
jgi:hypothetical protein